MVRRRLALPETVVRFHGGIPSEGFNMNTCKCGRRKLKTPDTRFVHFEGVGHSINHTLLHCYESQFSSQTASEPRTPGKLRRFDTVYISLPRKHTLRLLA
jgi:hypothetical protein